MASRPRALDPAQAAPDLRAIQQRVRSRAFQREVETLAGTRRTVLANALVLAIAMGDGTPVTTLARGGDGRHRGGGSRPRAALRR